MRIDRLVFIRWALVRFPREEAARHRGNPTPMGSPEVVTERELVIRLQSLT
jgi:hypothetical protein